MSDLQENVIEWYTGEDVIALTITQRKYITLVKKLVAAYQARGDKRATLLENEDGSIFCHLPLEAMRLRAKAKRDVSDAQRQIARDRLAAARGARAAQLAEGKEEAEL